MKTHINTLEESKAFVSEFRSQPGYRQPWAFATGIATVSRAGNILDTYYPFLNHLSNPGSSTVLSVVNNHLAGTATFEMDPSMRDKIFAYFTPFIDDGKPHPNIEAIDTAFRVVNAYNNRHGSGKRVVVTFIDHPEHDHGPTDVPNAYLRLALLSSGLMRRKEDVVLEGISEFLPINMWTSEGPVAPEDLQYRQLL
ncbi:MAG: tetrahydrodipicolinate N-succinyltransferase N-terminal domain-containing protein, partial [Bacteroidota bacterium]